MVKLRIRKDRGVGEPDIKMLSKKERIKREKEQKKKESKNG